jgi:hypothetical protein
MMSRFAVGGAGQLFVHLQSSDRRDVTGRQGRPEMILCRGLSRHFGTSQLSASATTALNGGFLFSPRIMVWRLRSGALVPLWPAQATRGAPPQLPSRRGFLWSASAASVKAKICGDSQSVLNTGELARRMGVALMPKQVLYRWAIYLIRGRAALLGSVHAPDQKSAITAAIEKFGVKAPQLLARPIGNVHPRSQRNVGADTA